MADLEKIRQETRELLEHYGYNTNIADKIISVVRPGVVLVEINGEKMEMYL